MLSYGIPSTRVLKEQLKLAEKGEKITRQPELSSENNKLSVPIDEMTLMGSAHFAVGINYMFALNKLCHGKLKKFRSLTEILAFLVEKTSTLANKVGHHYQHK